jgi:hypothetical protein
MYISPGCISIELILFYLIAYMKTVKAKLVEKGAPAEEVSCFEKGAQAFAKKIVANFKDYEFLIGESMDINGMYVINFLSCLDTFCNEQAC